MLREAGGEVFRYSGDRYHHSSQVPGLVAVRDPEQFEPLRRELTSWRDPQ